MRGFYDSETMMILKNRLIIFLRWQFYTINNFDNDDFVEVVLESSVPR